MTDDRKPLHARQPLDPEQALDSKWIDTVMDRFEDASLPPSELTHGVHLLIAMVYARQNAPDPAQPFRLALHRYLEKRAGDTRAYHETCGLMKPQSLRKHDAGLHRDSSGTPPRVPANVGVADDGTVWTNAITFCPDCISQLRGR